MEDGDGAEWMQPLSGLEGILGTGTQGSSCLATAGLSDVIPLGYLGEEAGKGATRTRTRTTQRRNHFQFSICSSSGSE